MASSSSSSSRALFLYSLLQLALVLLSFSVAEGGDVLVGGKTDAWKVPSSESDSLNKWSEKARFRIGDSLVWKGSKDSVLEVSEVDYKNCNITNPIEEYKYEDGEDMKVKLERSGPFFFVSGVKGHCQKGQKMRVVVVSPRHRSFLAPAPAPAVAPTSGAAKHGGALVAAFGALVLGLF